VRMVLGDQLAEAVEGALHLTRLGG